MGTLGTDILSFTAISVLIGVCCFLALWCKYQSGIVGHIALAAVVIGGVIMIMEGDFYEFSEAELLTFAGLALFMGRHLHRRWYRLFHDMPVRRRDDVGVRR